MKTSCIRHPENSRFVKRHDWQLQALGDPADSEVVRRSRDPEIAAEIMSIFEFHYNNRWANRMLREVMAKAPAANRQVDVGDWMPYSVPYISEMLISVVSAQSVVDALDLLMRKGFVSGDLPPDIRAAYPTRARWYRLEVDAINRWIEANCEKSWTTEWRRKRKSQLPTGRPPGRPAKPAPDIAAGGGEQDPPAPAHPATQQDPTDNEAKYAAASTLFNYYKNVHGKNGAFVFDSQRRNKVTARINEHRSLASCAQAIVGNLMSDYHQGRHPDNDVRSGGKVYDDIELIFRHAKNFENHCRYAEERGVTEEIALEDLQAFVRGAPSRYAKAAPKTPPAATGGQAAMPQQEPPNAINYKTFARAVAAFFTSHLPVADIVEMAKTTENLRSISANLTDAEYLRSQIVEATKPFRPQGPSPEMVDDIWKFSSAFARLQQLSGE